MDIKESMDRYTLGVSRHNVMELEQLVIEQKMKLFQLDLLWDIIGQRYSLEGIPNEICGLIDLVLSDLQSNSIALNTFFDCIQQRIDFNLESDNELDSARQEIS